MFLGGYAECVRVMPRQGLKVFRQNVPERLSSSCEELPVNGVISRVHIVSGLRHGSLVGLCERMPFKVILRVR